MVYKGCQKRMIVIKNPDGDFFEEAHFVLKEIYNKTRPASEDSMIKEANRILNKYSLVGEEKKRKKSPPRAVLTYLLGFATGLGVFLLVQVIFS